MYSTRTYRLLMLFSVAITIFVAAWFVFVAGGFGLFALPMVIPYFIAPAIVYYLQLRRQNDHYALLLIPFVLYEFLHLLVRIKLLLGVRYGFEPFYPVEGVSLLGFLLPQSFNYFFGVWTGPMLIFALILFVHTVTVSAAYTRVIWKQFMLPLILIVTIGFFVIITLQQYSSASQSQTWKKFISQKCNYSIDIHPAMTSRFGDSFGSQHLFTAGYSCGDTFAANTSEERASVGVYMYSSKYPTLQEWLVNDWLYGGLVDAFYGGHPLLPKAFASNYPDENAKKTYLKTEIEKLLPTGDRVNVNGYQGIEFTKNDTVVLFIAGPDKRIAELRCGGATGTTITTQSCREMLHSFSFEK